jgi:hypothetical protein
LKYAEHAIVLKMESRKAIARGDAMPVSVDEGPSRVGSGMPFSCAYGTSVYVDGRMIINRGWESAGDLGASGTSSFFGNLAIDCAKLKNGAHTLEMDFDVSLFEGTAKSNRSPITREKIRRAAKWTLLPANESSVELVDDRAHQIEAADKIRIVRVQRERTGNHWLVWISVQKMSLDVAASLVVQSGKQRWYGTGSVIVRAGDGGFSCCMITADRLDASHVDVILSGSATVARNTRDMTRIWGGRFLYKDVPVIRDPADKPVPKSSPIKPIRVELPHGN